MKTQATLAIHCLVTAAFLLVNPASSLGQAPAGPDVVAPKQVSALMHKKLDHAKNILEGLTKEQYGTIESNARSLRLLSMEAGWKVIQTKEYRAQSEEFRRRCDSIEKAAKAKDIDRAALAYVALTVRCVECHNYMRENKLELAHFDGPMDLKSLVRSSRQSASPQGLTDPR